jgi:PIN domain nuclease of toxin-antitoxin system
LDTHLVIWLARETDKISDSASKAMASARKDGGLAIAAATVWEIALLAAKGRLQFDPPVEVFLEKVESSYRVLQLDRRVAIRATQFSIDYPRDPADRQIGATAIIHGLTLVTADQRILRSGEVPCLW